MSSKPKFLFPNKKPIIGVVHLSPLAGSPLWKGSFAKVKKRALKDAVTLAENGIDGIIVENYGDKPFYPDHVEPQTVASMALIAEYINKEIGDVFLGINVLRNDARSALAIASVVGADFIRVNVHTGVMITDQGMIEGRAFQTLRYRYMLQSKVAIFADVFVKHGTPLGNLDLVTAAKDTYQRGMADALIVTGPRTGEETNLDDVKRIKSLVQKAPVFVGSGVNDNNISETLKCADGIIVGTALKRNGKTENEVDAQRVKRLLARAGR
jgi:membrane complex biogenesis BtpA family protein